MSELSGRDLTRQSDQLLGQGQQILRDNRAGGRHRKAVFGGAGLLGRGRSIGQASARLKIRHWVGKLKRITLSVAGIIGVGIIAGLVLGGIQTSGVLIGLLAIFAAVTVFSIFPRITVPSLEDLTKGDLRQMVGKTELWLEHQRAALPPPASNILGTMGVQLDALGLQLEQIDPDHQAAREVRKLVGEALPETLERYNKIPAHLRGQEHGGATADEHVTESLDKISKEIGRVAQQMAEGSLDDLAIQNRYLDYKYGDAGDDIDGGNGGGTNGGDEGGDEGVADR